MADEIEAIGEKKKSMQDIIDMMQAQVRASESMPAVSTVTAPAGQPSSPGLSMVNGPKKGVMATASEGNAPIQLDPPRNTNKTVKASAERVAVLLQVEADSQSRVEAQKRQEANAVAFERKFISQKKLVWNEVANNESAEGESAATKVFRWVGVAAAIALAAVASVASGGAAVGLIVAAAVALAVAIAEESGGTKEMEKLISLSLQKNQGMSKKDADAAAGQITSAVMTVVQVGSSLGANSLSTGVEQTAKEVAKVGMNAAAKNVVGDMATKAAETAVKSAEAGVKSAEAGVKAAESTLKSAQEALKGAKEIGGETLKSAEAAVQEAQKTLDSAQKTLDSAKETLETAKAIEDKLPGAIKEISKETKEAIKKAADEGVEIVQKNASDAVEDATKGLTDKLTKGLAQDDPLKLKIDAFMKNVKTEATDFMQKVEGVAKAQKGFQAVNTVISGAESAVNGAEQVKQTQKQKEVEVLKEKEEIAQEDVGNFNEQLSAEFETTQKSFKRVSNLMDSVIKMMDSREESLRETTMMV